MPSLRLARWVAGAAIGLCLAGPVAAEEILLPYGGINLVGTYEAAGRERPSTAALITHGTLAHGGMEVIAGLQAALAERGIASLAHNLSYGIDERRDMYHCAVDHTHHDEDADKEIAAWLDWLRGQGVRQLALIGHSRGGRQAARVAAAGAEIDALVLLAPLTAGAEAASRDGFEELYDAPYEPMLEEARTMRPDASMDTPGFLFCPKAHVRASSILSYYGEAPRGAEDFVGDVKTRILIIAAEEDEIVPDVETRFEDLDDGDRLVVETVEGADHFFLSFFAEDAADLIAEFLNGQVKGDFGIAWEEADLAYGEYLGGECVGCHTGAGAGGVPGIEGLDPAYLYSALRAYGSGKRDNAAMRSVSQALDAEQMIALSAYFASLGTD